MQRKSEELQLAVQEYLDVDWTSVKYYLRRQIAKCVQECKSQATNAKRIAKSLKHNHSSLSNDGEANGTCESDDDSDDWGSDFEDDSEDELKDEPSSFEVNNNTIIQSTPGILDTNSGSCSALPTTNCEEKSIPKPPDVPLISKSINGSLGFKSSSLTSSIPRPPLKRPPSQPPPPPIPQATSHGEPQEDYEIPIVSASSCINDFTFSDTHFQNSTSVDSSMADTYEIVEPPEENYEMVDPVPIISQNMVDKPLIPPRNLKGLGIMPPPPLPQKPQKLKENLSGSERFDGVRTFSRPKLPVKAEMDQQPETNQSTSSTTANVGFISSLIGRRPSTTPSSSPKSQHRGKEPNDSIISSPSPMKFSNDSLSSCSSSPDRDGFSLSEGKKMPPLPPLPPRSTLNTVDELVQNMATRPLPPVPEPKEEDKTTKQLDIQQCPWFHEMEREDAEAAVRKLNEAGSFVVRPSKRAGKENPYSLTVLHEDKLFHLNIRHRPDNTFALGKEKEKEKTFETVAELITFHLKEPILLKNRGEPAGKTILRKYPEKT